MLQYRDICSLNADTQPTANLRKYTALSDQLPMGILITDQHGTGLYCNAAYQKLCGRAAGELIGSHWCAVIHPKDRDAALIQWNAALQGQCCSAFESRLEPSNGKLVWTRRNTALMTDHTSGRVFVHTVEDISTSKAHEYARRKAEDQLFAEKERAQVTLDSIGDAVISTDTTGRVSYMNAVAETLTGFTRDVALGRPLKDIFHVVDAKRLQPTADPAQRAMQSNSIVALKANSLLIAKDGVKLAIEDSAAPIHDRDGAITGAVIVFHDARYSRKTTARMAYLAHHDALTGLYNRNAFYERFAQSLALAQRHGKNMGLLFIDLDNFKNMNDNLGHECGDLILTALAGILRTCVRLTDTICRYGGDEFVVLLGEIDQPGQALTVAEKIHEAVGAPITVAQKTLSLRLSIGVSVFPDNGRTADALLREADAAMYRAKTLKRQPTAIRGLVTTSENRDAWPKHWCRRKTDGQFRA